MTAWTAVYVAVAVGVLVFVAEVYLYAESLVGGAS